MNSDLLLELGCEDLPARYVVPLADALANGIAGGLTKRGITIGDVRRYATPRRIAVVVSGVATQQPDQKIDITGPAMSAALKDGQPTPAALGFARKCGIEFTALVQKDGKLHYAKTEAGKKTSALIPEIFEDTLKQMDELVPKRMRWGDGNETFVRPVQWLCALLGGDVIVLERFGLKSGRSTYGHRFHAPAAIELKSPAEYADKLKTAQVWADVPTRKAEIRRQIEAQAALLKGHARITEDLLDEVTALVEKPVAITGHFEDRFLELPPEVIVATVETNQRYFTVFRDTAHTQLTNAFITISNIESRDVTQVIAGNERVVRPRLTDALFFWQQDRFENYVLEGQTFKKKRDFALLGAKLREITFVKGLGTLENKVNRVQSLASEICKELRISDELVQAAAALCKNDLCTKMVYEFPELQGIIGGYYISEDSTITNARGIGLAVKEHYLPTQQGTPIPSTLEGQIVALADKLDTLAGIFAIGQKPTASKDPFALRRAALGALRICIEGGLALDLATLLSSALDVQPAGKRDAATLKELTEFTLERLRAYYDALPVEMFEAVRTLNITTPLDFHQRIQALRDFWALPDAKNLAAAHKRVRNILKQATDTIPAQINANLFEHDAERALSAQLSTSAGTDYADKLRQLAALRPAVDAFFTAVMVNVEDAKVRANRLALLQQLDRACREVADISYLPG